MNLGQELAQIRKDKGVTQRWLAEQLQRHILDMTEDKLSRRFLGKIEVTGVELLLIGKYLGIDLNELSERLINMRDELIKKAQGVIDNLEGQEVYYCGNKCEVKNGVLFDLEQSEPNHIDLYAMSDEQLQGLIEELG